MHVSTQLCVRILGVQGQPKNTDPGSIHHVLPFACPDSFCQEQKTPTLIFRLGSPETDSEIRDLHGGSLLQSTFRINTCWGVGGLGREER